MRSSTSARRTRLVAPHFRIPVADVAVLATAGVIVSRAHVAGDTHAGQLDCTFAGRVDMRHGLVWADQSRGGVRQETW